MNIKDKYNGEALAIIIDTSIVIAEEGTGDNLLSEDIEDGYIDYINWTIYDLKVDADNAPIFVEGDGGMVLTRSYVCEMTVEEICERICDEVGYPNNHNFVVRSLDSLTL